MVLPLSSKFMRRRVAVPSKVEGALAGMIRRSLAIRTAGGALFDAQIRQDLGAKSAARHGRKWSIHANQADMKHALESQQALFSRVGAGIATITRYELAAPFPLRSSGIVKARGRGVIPIGRTNW
jgi:hypothetical protein